MGRRKKRGRDDERRTTRKVSYLDRNDITYFDYKDVDILKRFTTKKGRIKSRKRTGVTAAQQRRLTRAIKHARYLALLPYTDTHGK